MGTSAQPLPVDAWTDFTCPFSFLASLSLRRLREELPLELRWRSMLTRPEGLPPLTPEMRQAARGARAGAAARALSEFGLELRPGPLELDTLPAHLALKHAERSGLGDACQLAIMRAYWLEAAPIDRREALERIARGAGLGAAIPWDDPALSEAVQADIGLAQSLDLYFVPALRFGERTIVAGAESYEHLRAAARMAATVAAHAARCTRVPRPASLSHWEDDRDIDEAERESFPASDPPAYTLGIERARPSPSQ